MLNFPIPFAHAALRDYTRIWLMLKTERPPDDFPKAICALPAESNRMLQSQPCPKISCRVAANRYLTAIRTRLPYRYFITDLAVNAFRLGENTCDIRLKLNPLNRHPRKLPGIQTTPHWSGLQASENLPFCRSLSLDRPPRIDSRKFRHWRLP